jgi:hypothetical protein
MREPSFSKQIDAALDLLLLTSGRRARHNLPAASLSPMSMSIRQRSDTAAHL